MAQESKSLSARTMNMDEVEKSLHSLQDAVHSINQELRMHRDKLRPSDFRNMIEAYKYVNELVKNKVDIFAAGNLEEILKINDVVVLGDPEKKSSEYEKETRDRWMRQIGPALETYSAPSTDSPYQRASNFFVNTTSRPQLFLYAPNRTGSLIASYTLLMHGYSPLVLDPGSAKEFFELTQEIKEKDRRKAFDRIYLRKYAREFRNFLEKNKHQRYMV